LKNTSHLGQKDARDKRARGNDRIPPERRRTYHFRVYLPADPKENDKEKRRHGAGACSCFKYCFYCLRYCQGMFRGKVNTSVTRCSVELHMTNAPNCSEMKRTGNIVRPGAWMYGTTVPLASMNTRLLLTHE